MKSDFRVEALALHAVGVFEDVRMSFPQIPAAQAAGKAEVYIFTGPNGSGKSTLLYAIADIFQDYTVRGPVWQRFQNLHSSVEFLVSGCAGCYSPERPPVNAAIGAGEWFSGVFGKFEEVVYHDIRVGFFGYDSARDLAIYKRTADQFCTKEIYCANRCPFAVFSYSGLRTVRNAPFEAIRPIAGSPFENALSFENTARPQVLMQWIANNRTQAALALADGAKEDAASYDQALERISGLIRDVCDLEVSFSLQRSPLAVNARIGGELVPFDGLPDGLKSIISWVGDLSLRLEAVPWKEEGDVFMQPVILLLDEIDIHLHPKWQRRILPAVQKLLPNAQIFVSTHSPFVVGSVEDAMVYRLPEPGARSGTQVVEGVPSSAGKSYRLILEEVFGIDGEFDVETESLFADFYLLRDQYMKSPNDAAPLLELGGKLAARGDELAQIVERELRQVSRVTGREIRLA